MVGEKEVEFSAHEKVLSKCLRTYTFGIQISKKKKKKLILPSIDFTFSC